MDSPLVTVVIPVYNVERYVNECLNSVVQQSYKSIELIIINDGSTDNSISIVNKYASTYPFIQVINQENSGQSVARNKGIELSKGKYIYFLDADDYILPETLSNLVKKMELFDLDLIRFAAEPFVEEGTKISIVKKKQYDFNRIFNSGENVYNKSAFLKVSSKAFSASPCLYLVRKDILLSNNIRFKEGIVHEDELFTLKIFLNTKNAMYDSEAYYKRRYRNHSVMTGQKAKNTKRSFYSYLTVLSEMGKLLKNYSKVDEVALIRLRMRKIYGILINYPLDKKYKGELKKVLAMSKTEKIISNLQYKPIKYGKALYSLIFSKT